MKAILVEDEIKSQEHLSRLLSNHCPEITVCGISTSVKEAFSLIIKFMPDLIFLDIELGTENGFSLLQKIREKSIECSVIFTTAHEKYGIRAIKFSALDYLLKPIKTEELITAVQKAIDVHLHSGKNKQIDHLLEQLQLKAGQEQSIALSLSREIRFVQLRNIIQVSASNNYSMLHLDDGENFIVSKGIFYFDKLLVPAGFMRIHQSHIINPRFIRAIKKRERTTEIQLTNGSLVPIARLKVEQIKNMIVKQNGNT